jgi:G3E family GTPase
MYMKLILISGFLGSGKTTLIINLARQATALGQQIAILVNEIGEIGIDDQLMRQLDLNTWELTDGCICCTLSADLVTTLQTLDAEYQPDLVILEPSGAAEPGNIMRALPYYKGCPLESIKSVVLVDPLRIGPLYEVMTPLITKQIGAAELVIITKADLASAEEMEAAQRIITEIKPQAEIVALSARQPLDAALVGAIIS